MNLILKRFIVQILKKLWITLFESSSLLPLSLKKCTNEAHTEKDYFALTFLVLQ